nr:hypothetical protein [Candidatus Bathyarchaeota archaeon]
MIERTAEVSQKAVERINKLLKEENYPGNIDILLIDRFGNLVAQRIRYSDIEEAMESTFTLIASCNTISKTFAQGDATECIIRGEKGYIIAVEVEPTILVAAGIPDRQLGIMLQRLRSTAKKIKKIIEEDAMEKVTV